MIVYMCVNDEGKGEKNKEPKKIQPKAIQILTSWLMCVVTKCLCVCMFVEM